MSIESEIFDANCNNCKHMIRDLERYKIGLATHFKWQFDEFFRLRLKLLNNAMKKSDDFIRDMGDWSYAKKYPAIQNEATKMRFQFDSKEVSINYGYCSKLNKQVSFIPNILQIETQNCFEHRKG